MKRCAQVRVLLGVVVLLLALLLAGCSAGNASETPSAPSPSSAAPGASLPVGGGQDAGAPANQTAPVGTTVYVAEGGTKYHVLGCQYLNKSRTAISLSEAKSQGLTPCKVCKPPQ